MTAWLVTNLIALALLPPLSLAILLVAGLIVHRRRPRLAMSLILLSTTALYALSTPWVGGLLQKSLEISTPIIPSQLQTAEAIVVLGGGRRLDAAEYGSDTLHGLSLERLRYATFLHRGSGLPILVTGGNPGGGALSEGRIMQYFLQNEYGTSPQWGRRRRAYNLGQRPPIGPAAPPFRRSTYRPGHPCLASAARRPVVRSPRAQRNPSRHPVLQHAPRLHSRCPAHTCRPA